MGTRSPQLGGQDLVAAPRLQFHRSVILFTAARRGRPSRSSLPLSARTSPSGTAGTPKAAGLRQGWRYFRTRGGGGEGARGRGRGPTLNLGTDSSSSLFLVQIPTTRGSSTISTGRLLDIYREKRGGGGGGRGLVPLPRARGRPPPPAPGTCQTPGLGTGLTVGRVVGTGGPRVRSDPAPGARPGVGRGGGEARRLLTARLKCCPS